MVNCVILCNGNTKGVKCMCNRGDYFNAINELIEFAVMRYESEIKAIYTGGSVARGDFVPGRSDIDIYVVIEDADKDKIQRDLASGARKIELKYFKDFKHVHDEVLGVSVTTLDEIRKGKSFLGAGFEYRNFIHTGKLLWGEDIKQLIPKPTPKEEREAAQKTLRNIYQMTHKWEKFFRWLMWIPLQLIPRKTKEKWARQAFSLIFRSAAILLSANKIYVSGKKETAAAFQKRYPEEKELQKIIVEALKLWEKWKTNLISNKETKQLIKNSPIFVQGVNKILNPK